MYLITWVLGVGVGGGELAVVLLRSALSID